MADITADWKKVPLKKPVGAVLKKVSVDVDLNSLSKFYLPNTVTMEVIGVVEGISCLCDQLVLLTCEDQRVYGYDEEELHLVALSIKELFDKGIEYPASKTYYRGEAFKEMNRKDWEQIWNGQVGRKLEQEHQIFVATTKPKLFDFMKQNGLLKRT